ncbi:aspergillopepsin A precursor [Rhizodiscina lignyota]|uniref:Aspergillopepsin A n=1 Tax=Rhizodiscina lignyota TaxID=1504668 RepID=A0A9P4ILV0_9PEZI|nr:aspergillopepsin A precursor [Rhizodiscina lignyota]
MLKVFRKFGFNTDLLKRQNTTTGGTQTGTTAAVSESNDSEFLEPVTVGGQKFNLDFDTGSSDLWVFSTSLSQQTIGQHSAYDPTKSNTVQPMQGATWQISYGDGSGAAGTVVTDQVNIGGATVTTQAVEMATALSQSFVQDTDNDGLVGLAFSKLNTVRHDLISKLVQPTQQKTFFDNIMPSLQMPVFSVDLRGNSSAGSYTFGAIDQTKFQGSLTNVPVDNSQGFWMVTSNSFAVGNQVQQNPQGSPAIADTGTSLVLVDDNVAQAYYSQVPGATNNAQVGGFTYSCNAQLPNFSVALGNYMATIPGNMVTFAQVDANTCFGGVQSNQGSGMQIYGDVMFKTQYVVFDGSTPQLMLAPKA